MITADRLEHNAAPAPSLPMPLELAGVRIDPAWAMRLPADFARRRKLLALCQLENCVVVAATSLDIDSRSRTALANYLQCDYRLALASDSSLREALDRVYSVTSFETSSETIGTATTIGTAAPSSAPKQTVAGDSPKRGVVSNTRIDASDASAACDELLQAAVLRGASDIHLVPTEQLLLIQLRVDGELELYRQLPLTMHSAMTSRLKVLAGLDIAEKRAPQDGRISTHKAHNDQRFDIRVATLPTRHGERMTLRLLAPPDDRLSLAGLGMRESSIETFESATARPHGLILLTGPTGSGKSTTLYVAIEQLMRARGGNVITIEDPIEYEINGASQVEVDSADKVSFSKALRSLLRHDPDVVMIGEIRDAETANIAVKASLTGHLVFSTLHTNTAAGVVTRLIDLGIEPFLIAATLRMSVAQRLVRGLCPHCRKPHSMTEREANLLGRAELAGQTSFVPQGCVICAGRGYRGRIGLFEMLPGSEELARVIAGGADEQRILDFVTAQRLPMLVDDGIGKILDGTTTVDEVISAVQVW